MCWLSYNKKCYWNSKAHYLYIQRFWTSNTFYDDSKRHKIELANFNTCVIMVIWKKIVNGAILGTFSSRKYARRTRTADLWHHFRFLLPPPIYLDIFDYCEKFAIKSSYGFSNLYTYFCAADYCIIL